MKEVRRSKHLATVIKKKNSSSSSSSSSGCLIIENKVTDSSSSKRPRRVAETDSMSSDNSSSPYKREKRESNGFDVFEFDEYDDTSSSIRNDANRWNLMESRNKSSMNLLFQIQDDDDESDLPLSVLRKKYRSDKPKGKNDILKVMVNKNKHNATSDHPKPTLVHNKRLHTDAVDHKSSFYSNSNKKSLSKRKLVAPVKGKESKIKHGSATEKQLLREKIKNMLLAADWTIDYRPRRNRDYLDAVYISPTGTGYWSIIKAYEAFQKEEGHNSNDGANFALLPDEILGKLTRKTQKKVEKEMINKRKKDINEENHGRKTRKIDRCTLLVRASHNSENGGFVPYSGKRTLLSWLIESGVVHTSEHVEYMAGRKTRVMQRGWITKDGICCGCCNKLLTALKFERHAGSKLCQPFQNMVLESGKSLMRCQIDAWNKQGELEREGFYSVDVNGDDPNDDTCGICGDGGDLICCDGCPSTSFHQTCLNIQMLPQGDWHCPNCSCKYCELAVGDCIEVDSKTEDPLLLCCLCQKKYHESCRPEINVKPIESSYPNLSFCEHKCHELYSHLQKLVGVKHELDSGFSWSLIHRSDLSMDASSVQLSQQVECNSMLAVAMLVMDECFLPFTDRRSGTNLIRNVVFNCGSNLSRLNYSGFFTAILEREDEMVSAASIRVHGIQLAEMPFIGTRHIYRRQGMCRRLLSAVESALSSLQVEKLVIPAVAEHMHTWTDVFGFRPLEELHKQELKSMNMVVFPGTDMLQKPLVKQDNPPNAILKDKNTAEIDDYRALSEKSEFISSDEKDCSDKTTTRDFGYQEPSVPLDDASKETLSMSSPPVKDDDMANRSEMVSSIKTADANSHPAQVPDVSREPKPSVSVEEESSLQEQVDNCEATEVPAVALCNTISSVIPCQLSEKEFLSISSHSDTNIEDEIMVQNGNVTHLIPTQDPNVQEQIGMQNGDGTNIVPPAQVHDTLPSHLQVQHSEKKSYSCVDLQNGCETANNTTDVISLEAQAPPNVACNITISSDKPPPSANEFQSLDAHSDVRLEKLSAEFSGGKEGSCEMN